MKDAALDGQFEMRARSGDPDTSHEAATRVTELLAAKNNKGMAEVLAVVAAAGDYGATPDEVYDALPHHQMVSISPRFAPMKRIGLIHDSGERRKSRMGFNQQVLKLGPGLADAKKKGSRELLEIAVAALHSISLGAQNSMAMEGDLGFEARRALAKIEEARR